MNSAMLNMLMLLLMLTTVFEKVSRKKMPFTKAVYQINHSKHFLKKLHFLTNFLSKAVVVNSTDEVSHESCSDFNINARENELIEIKHTGAASIL